MNKKEITITAPKGQVIDYNETKGTINFVAEPRDIKERIKTFDDVLSELQIIPKDFAQQCDGLSKDEIGYRKEKLIVAAFNKGITPDFTDGTDKYYPLFKMGSPSGVGFSFHDFGNWCTCSSVGARLVFCGPDAKANMLYAVKKFLPEYKESRTT